MKNLPYKMFSVVVYRDSILEKVCFEKVENIDIDDKVDYKFIEQSIASFALFNDAIQEFLFRKFCNRYFNDPKIIEIANLAMNNESTFSDEISMVLVVNLTSISGAANYDYQLRIDFVKNENEMLDLTKSNLSNDFSKVVKNNISHLYKL
jgi:hypothetical protein